MSNSSSRQQAARSPWATYRPTALVARLKNIPEGQKLTNLPDFLQVFASQPQALPIKLLRHSFMSTRGLFLRLAALPLIAFYLPLQSAAAWGLAPLRTAVLATLAWALASFGPTLLCRLILARHYGVRAGDVQEYFMQTVQPQLLTYQTALHQDQDEVTLALATAHQVARFQQWVDFSPPFTPAPECSSRHHPSSAQRYPEPLSFEDPLNPYRNDFIDIVSAASGPVEPHLMFKRGVTRHIVSRSSRVPHPWRWILKDPTRLHGCDTRGTSFCLTLAAFSWAWRQELLPAVRAFQDGQASGADLETAYARFRARYPLTDPHGYQDHPHKH